MKPSVMRLLGSFLKTGKAARGGQRGREPEVAQQPELLEKERLRHDIRQRARGEAKPTEYTQPTLEWSTTACLWDMAAF